MKRAFFVIPALILFSLVLTVSEARACEPCSKELSLNFEETARKADLIIIGQRYDFRPDELKHGTFGPENIRVQVRRVFKGEEGRDEITVKSWSGMCPYGIILNDNLPHVIFLKKEGDAYRAVDMCSVKDYLIKDDMVQFGNRKLTIEEFRLKLEKVR